LWSLRLPRALLHTAIAAYAGAAFSRIEDRRGDDGFRCHAGVAISAPIFGALTERLPRKRVIVASLVGISLPTLLAATSTSLAQLVFWRFLQGITVPGVIAVLVTYIGEEWPADQVALVISFYVSGTALGGFIGRVLPAFLLTGLVGA